MATRIPTRSRRRLVCLGLLGLALHSLPAQAKRAPGADVRAKSAATPPRLREIEASGPPRTAALGARAQFGEQSRLLRDYYQWSPEFDPRPAGTPRAVATRFLVENAAALGLDPAGLDADLRLVAEKRTPSGMHYTWQQVVGGVPVFRAEVVLKVANRGQVASMHSTLRQNLRVGTRPAFDPARALQVGLEAVRPAGKPLGPYGAELAIVEYEDGPGLTYLVSIPVDSPLGDWRVYVDARTGAVRGIEDRAVYVVDGSGRGFDPDPRTKMNNATYVDDDDADSAVPFPDAYDVRTLRDITETAGRYSLAGPFVRLLDFESPAIAPVTTTDPHAFLFQRNADGFEDVNVYLHIDASQRYIQSLGFMAANNRVQEVDAHGLGGADNSHYLPSTQRMAFGDGGVDDAEDADIILHEYGHAIEYDIDPNWGGGNEAAMGEGFGDYWAGSHSYAVNPGFESNWVFNWDGHNAFWSGRVLVDSTLHYPENCCGEIHASGTLWCSALFDCLRRIGRAPMDAIVLDHHFGLGSSATMAEAALQIIQSDQDLFGGAHLSTLVAVFGYYGLVDPADFVPVIAHAPLRDTEDTSGPWMVRATITSVHPLVPGSLLVHWGTGAFGDSLPMAPTANPDEYAAAIPGPLFEAAVRYYIVAVDSLGSPTTHPPGAPASYHEFHVGIDTIPPAIVHSPLADRPLVRWPPSIVATATDNLGVDVTSVAVSWTLNGVPQPPFGLAQLGVTDEYTGSFPAGGVAIGDSIAYHLTATDRAAVPNAGRDPASGEHRFALTDILGRILIVDDDDLPKAPDVRLVDGTKNEVCTVTPGPAAGPPGTIQSANAMAQVLEDAGYSATVEPMATTDSATWGGYDLIVHASGSNPGPLESAAYRAALEAWVAGHHKLLVEGGEVVYDAAGYPGYPSFAANVLHTTDWDASNAGSLALLAAQAAHPIATTPYALPATIPLAYVDYSGQDSYKPNSPAYVVYGTTSFPANGGILVYDDTPPPESAQIVLWGFDFGIVADPTTRGHLLLNTVHYLLGREPAPDGEIRGVVRLAGQADHAGVVVTASPGGATATTDAAGSYTLPDMYPVTYTLAAAKPGYASESRLGVTVAPHTPTLGQDFKLYPRPEVQYCSTPKLAIPDGVPAGVTSAVTVSETWAVQEVVIDLNLTHTWIGDLIVELRHGSRTVRLHNRTGSSDDNIIGTYPTTLAVDGPGALTDFAGEAANGTWTLFVADNVAVDWGTLVSWCLKLHGPKDTTVGIETVALLPQVETLSQARNPVPAAGTSIRYGLPREEHASLVIFDVAGRRVRTLLDAVTPAGFHDVHWDGRETHGSRVAAGVYFYQLAAGRTTEVRKLVVVR